LYYKVIAHCRGVFTRTIRGRARSRLPADRMTIVSTPAVTSEFTSLASAFIQELARELPGFVDLVPTRT